MNPVDGVLVYTDGSYTNNGPGGWSWVAVDAHRGMVHGAGATPPPTTNNRMEMTAQCEALETLYKDYGACELEIVSDSQYVVLGCQYPGRKRNVNLDLWNRLDTAIRLHNWVQWRHVRGHIGVKWNELADELARQARKEARWQLQR